MNPPACLGIDKCTKKIRQMGYVTDKETVRFALKTMGPTGVSQLSRHRLRRRQYISQGPNYAWHIDGYDKLKPYGFAIHGAIDGYSRKMIWLTVAATNNNPNVVATYYVRSVNKLQIVPRLIRTDRGSENIIIGGLQRFFRRNCSDQLAGNGSFQYGPSTRNQRIEAWWSQLRKSRSDWWITFFKDYIDAGDIDLSIEYHFQCVRITPKRIGRCEKHVESSSNSIRQKFRVSWWQA